jgi:hypothetical protein
MSEVASKPPARVAENEKFNIKEFFAEHWITILVAIGFISILFLSSKDPEISNVAGTSFKSARNGVSSIGASISQPDMNRLCQEVTKNFGGDGLDAKVQKAVGKPEWICIGKIPGGHIFPKVTTLGDIRNIINNGHNGVFSEANPFTINGIERTRATIERMGEMVKFRFEINRVPDVDVLYPEE